MRLTFAEYVRFWGVRAQGGGAHIDIAEGAGQSTNWSSVVQLGGVVFAAAVTLVLGFLVIRWLRSRSRSAAAAPVHVISKEVRARINAAMEAGEYERAGDIFSRAGAHEDAAECYARARSWTKAARSYQVSGNLAQAIHFYKQAGDIIQAARLYADSGQHMDAAAEFVQCKEFAQAAEQYELAGDERRAAENFERAAESLRAAVLYEKGGLTLKAAENFAQHFDALLKKADGNIEALDEETRHIALRAGRLFKEGGELQRASAILHQGGYYAEAAGCLRTSGDFTRAAELLMKAQKPLLAAQVLEEAGQRQEAFSMRAEAALEEGDTATAAALFRDAGELTRAVELFESVQDWAEAAAVHEELGDQKRAGELYVRAQKYAHAARCAEALEEWHAASQLYRRAGDVDGELRALKAQGDYFRAGRLQFEHRRYDDALETLSRIDSRDPIYPRSLELQGDVLSGQNRFEKAYSRYRAALGNREVDATTLPLFYKMARALEEEQDFAGAVEHYKHILSVDSEFEDTSLRVKAIRGRLRRSSLPGVTGSGIFASEDMVEGRRYEIVDEVARGGMGIVYKARDAVLGRIVAFKILGENLRDNETAVKYFLREARAAAALSHPNIVTIFDAGEQDGEYYMAMEFVEGTTLKELVRRKGALPEDQVRYILIHCCRALQYAHSKGIIHRDIKSGNVMITRDKALKIMDFGLAKFMREYQRDHTQQVGTPFYMSPEQIIGKDVDFRSDLYSLGCTIFECATGTVPFFKGDLSYHHVHTRPPSPRSVNPALTKELEKAILKMLEKDPDDRFQSAKEILEAMAIRQPG